MCMTPVEHTNTKFQVRHLQVNSTTGYVSPAAWEVGGGDILGSLFEGLATASVRRPEACKPTRSFVSSEPSLDSLKTFRFLVSLLFSLPPGDCYELGLERSRLRLARRSVAARRDPSLDFPFIISCTHADLF